jgi:hypothetical protein
VGPGPRHPGHLWARWLFLRALGLIFFSAFFSLAFQIRGLNGPDGILPAGEYLRNVSEHLDAPSRVWYAPTLLWLGSGLLALKLLWAAGLAASVLIVLNLWPRAAVAVCFICFLSFVSAAQDFSSYQSDGMLLAAAFLCLFFAPSGLRPGIAQAHPPSRASLFLLQWLWFRIYFESGLVKISSGDPEWRHLTAMDHYYENGPLPDWIGWYAQQLPHAFHAGIALFALIAELGLAWMLFLPRRWRIACFFIVTPFQVGIILTANLAFLNYFVLALGVLLLDDRFLGSTLNTWRRRIKAGSPEQNRQSEPLTETERDQVSKVEGEASQFERTLPKSNRPASDAENPQQSAISAPGSRWVSKTGQNVSLILKAACLGWVFYVATALLLLMLFPTLPLPTAPITALQPFRIANQYGLFAVMTRARYEIEFQGSTDGKTWVAYPFRYKPQDPHQPPRIHAPYQPRFDWNLWFASLETWRQHPWVVHTEQLLLENAQGVLPLFAGNPFSRQPPRQVRAVIWRYWFTDLVTKRKEGLWWHRELRGLYAPTLEREPDGKFVVVEWPGGTVPSLAPQTPEP